MLLFLDFDGVLHPKGAGAPQFTQLPLFEAFLRKPEVKDVRIVISSTWRHAYELPKLRAFFSPDIGARILGGTPTLASYRTEYERGEEIEAWLGKHPSAFWVALDDDEEGFAPRLRPRLVLCDGTRGLDESDLANVFAKLFKDY